MCNRTPSGKGGRAALHAQQDYERACNGRGGAGYCMTVSFSGAVSIL